MCHCSNWIRCIFFRSLRCKNSFQYFNCHILNVNSFRLILFPTILFDDGVVTIRVRSNTGTALSPRCTGARRIAGILDSHKVLPALQTLEGSLGLGDSPKIPSLFPWTVLHLQHHKRITKDIESFIPETHSHDSSSLKETTFHSCGLHFGSLACVEAVWFWRTWLHYNMTCWPNQWQQIFLLGLCWAVSHPEGMEHNLPYSGGALCMLRGTPMEAESFAF